MKLQSIFQDEDIKYGEIFDAKVKIENEQIVVEIENENVHSTYYYKTFAEFNEEWEDYEEPKEFWYICDFRVVHGIEGKFQFTREEIAKMKSIGNYFETEEEAKKAVEKLKALKRLKDKGFRFNAWYGGCKCIYFEINSL
jgi:hypothetical protein